MTGKIVDDNGLDVMPGDAQKIRATGMKEGSKLTWRCEPPLLLLIESGRGC